MSGWDVITDAVGRVVAGYALGPLGTVMYPIGSSIAEKFTDTLAPQQANGQEAPPYPGTSPEGEPPPGMPWPGAVPPPAPPLPSPPGGDPDGASGRAADAASDDSEALARVIEQLEELDREAASSVDAIHAAGEAGRKAMEDIARDVDDKITELKPRLHTPEAQQELRSFLKERLESAKQVLEQQLADAEDQARKTAELANRYAELGGAPDDGRHRGATVSGGSASQDPPAASSPTGGATSPAAAEPAGGQTPTAAAPFGAGMPGGMPAGMPMSMPSLPSFGGGGIPGLGGGGFGDPLSQLGGLGTASPGDTPQLQDDTPGTDDESGNGGLTLQDGNSGDGHDEHSGPDGAPEKDTDGPEEQGTQPAGAAGSEGTAESGDGSTGNTVPATKGTQVQYIDDQGNEVKVEARTEQSAAATRAHLNGQSVAESYADQNITLPPPGTPISDDKIMVSPNKLQAGDVGVFKDHLVMALGNSKVLVSGQVQPLDSVGSGPGFLGWIDPTKLAGASPAGQQPPSSPAAGETPGA
ncbi:DUF4226 domain-containing protein [Mycolicibacterium goodii]|uniref:DUF4226 domain-containing protein n=1 Tax=Mycolicibacterium goodii TaxID=134601 RepID=UPI001BDD3CE4|nr:DUF4226 domain-containing protein [Mycolicibacterium goodii]MBU8819281.1 DUF4226 domain-containing protein [Mycolicibacterium goodii]